MAFSVENYVFGDDDYLIGEDVMISFESLSNGITQYFPVSNMRSMAEPKNSSSGYEPCPDTYGGQYWIDPSDTSENNDHGGVHTNSGVQNKWFYLLSEGGIGSNDFGKIYNVQGIGIEKAQQIAYRNLVTYLTPNANFNEAREGSLQAAADLYGFESQEYISVMNAWHAVGVGGNYQLSNVLDEGFYYIVAQSSTDGNFYYLTAEPDASGQQLNAINTGTNDISSINTANMELKYVWAALHSGEGLILANDGNTIVWPYGTSAALENVSNTLIHSRINDDGSLSLAMDDMDGTVYVYLALSLDNSSFGFYDSEYQGNHLYFIPYQDANTALPSVGQDTDIKAYAHGNTIYIKMAEPAPVAVYDLFGRRVFGTDGKTDIQTTVPAAGIYVVQAGSTAKKVVVTD